MKYTFNCTSTKKIEKKRKERKSEHVSTAAAINLPVGTAEVTAGSDAQLSLCFSLSRQLCLFSSKWSQTEQSRTAQITHTHTHSGGQSVSIPEQG